MKDVILADNPHPAMSSQQLVQSTLDAISSHISIIDKDGEILFVNTGWRDFAKANQLRYENYGIGINYLEVCDTAEGNGSQGANEVAAGIRQTISGELAEFSMGYPCHGPKNQRWFELRVMPLKDYSKQGAIIFHEDVSERKQIEESLIERDLKYQALFEEAADAIFLMRSDHFVDCNPSTLTMFACTREQIINQSPYKFSPPRQPDGRASKEKALAYIQAALDGKPQRFEWVHIRADGTPFDAEVRLTRVDLREEIHILASVRDISERKKIEHERQLNESRLNSLLELSQKAHELSEHDIVQHAIETAVRLTDSEIGYLHFVNPDQNTIELVTWSEKTFDYCAIVSEKHYPLEAAGVWADCVRIQGPVIHNDYQNIPGTKGYPEGHARLVRHASIPVYDREKIAIILGVGNKLEDYASSDVAQMNLIGDQLVRILQRKRFENDLIKANTELESQLAEIEELQAQLREQAIRDPLTGLFNRRYLEENMGQAIARADRYNYPISLVMIDIDHFKVVNDTYGHRAGDKMLVALSTLLGEHVRKGDTICRYGGEEFVVMMPRASRKDAAERANQWREAFANLFVPFEEKTLNTTLSAGIATLAPENNDIEDAMREADIALYRSKSEGRNRVTISEKLRG